MAKKFQPGDLVYNRDTMEDGAVMRVYETNGSTMLEVGVPKLAIPGLRDAIFRIGLKMFYNSPTMNA
jgi:hypothetical protein